MITQAAGMVLVIILAVIAYMAVKRLEGKE